MSDNNTAMTTAPAQPEAENPEAGIDIDAVSERLDKHVQRLPWAASRMDGGPSSIQAFLVNWIVPMLTDMHTLNTYALDSNAEMEENVDALASYAQRTLVTAQNTLQGESLALLHMHFQRVHGAVMDKLAPTDPASFALTEMHEVFVKLGLAEPFFTEEAPPVDAGTVPEPQG